VRQWTWICAAYLTLKVAIVHINIVRAMNNTLASTNTVESVV
jgi:hypothetical protein